MFEKFFEVNNNSADTVRLWKGKTGKKVIGVMPEYFPCEVIAALGAYPVRFHGTQIPISGADTYLQSFSCTTARTMLEQALNGDMDYADAFVFTTMCDNQQNLSEFFRKLFPNKPVINFLIPFTSSVPIRKQHLEGQLNKSISELERITGNKFTQDGFAKARAVYERLNLLVNKLYGIRRHNPKALSAYEFYSILKAGDFLPPEEYINMLEPVVQRLAGRKTNGTPYTVVLSGITAEPLSLTRVFDDIGLYIVDDDLTNGSRLYSKGALAGIDADSLDSFVFGGYACSTLYNPLKDRRSELLEKAASNKAGVVLWQIKFCEPEAFERPDLMVYLKRHNVAVIDFEVELQMNSFEGIRTRLQAFKEIMEV